MFMCASLVLGVFLGLFSFVNCHRSPYYIYLAWAWQPCFWLILHHDVICVPCSQPSPIRLPQLLIGSYSVEPFSDASCDLGLPYISPLRLYAQQCLYSCINLLHAPYHSIWRPFLPDTNTAAHPYYFASLFAWPPARLHCSRSLSPLAK